MFHVGLLENVSQNVVPRYFCALCGFSFADPSVFLVHYDLQVVAVAIVIQVYRALDAIFVIQGRYVISLLT